MAQLRSNILLLALVAMVMLTGSFALNMARRNMLRKIGPEERALPKHILSCVANMPVMHCPSQSADLTYNNTNVGSKRWDSKTPEVRAKENLFRTDMDTRLKAVAGCAFENAGTISDSSDIDYNVIGADPVDCVDKALKVAHGVASCSTNLVDCLAQSFDVNFYPLSLIRPCDAIFASPIVVKGQKLCTIEKITKKDFFHQLNLLYMKCRGVCTNHVQYLEDARRLRKQMADVGGDKNQIEQLIQDWSKCMGYADASYVLPGSFRYVVVKDQLNVTIDLSPWDYLQAALENIVDYKRHYEHDEHGGRDFKKYSKYVMRAACAYAAVDPKYATNCTLLKTYVSECRKATCEVQRDTKAVEVATQTIDSILKEVQGKIDSLEPDIVIATESSDEEEEDPAVVQDRQKRAARAEKPNQFRVTRQSGSVSGRKSRPLGDEESE